MQLRRLLPNRHFETVVALVSILWVRNALRAWRNWPKAQTIGKALGKFTDGGGDLAHSGNIRVLGFADKAHIHTHKASCNGKY